MLCRNAHSLRTAINCSQPSNAVINTTQVNNVALNGRLFCLVVGVEPEAGVELCTNLFFDYDLNDGR